MGIAGWDTTVVDFEGYSPFYGRLVRSTASPASVAPKLSATWVLTLSEGQVIGCSGRSYLLYITASNATSWKLDLSRQQHRVTGSPYLLLGYEYLLTIRVWIRDIGERANSPPRTKYTRISGATSVQRKLATPMR